MAREATTDEVDGRGVGIDITDILVAADGGVVLRQHRAGVGVLLGLPPDAAGLAALRQRLPDAAAAAEQRIMNSYQAGLSAYPNVATAQAATLGARRSLMQLQLQRQQAALGLIQALGGGWQAPWAQAAR